MKHLKVDDYRCPLRRVFPNSNFLIQPVKPFHRKESALRSIPATGRPCIYQKKTVIEPGQKITYGLPANDFDKAPFWASSLLNHYSEAQKIYGPL